MWTSRHALRFVAVCTLASLVTFRPATAQIDEPSSSDFGGVGLLQTRTARFGADGSFEVGLSDVFPYRRYLINVQALPRVEATFRYTAIKNRGFFSGGPVTNNETSFKDRGADIKLHLLRERRWLPALAVGLQDGLGTGQFSGEYFVASKRFFDLDVSLGLAWGYPGNGGGIKNPLSALSDTFSSRTVGGSAFGGTFNAATWFRGPEVALTAGVEYQTPFRGLSLKLEYEGNDYRTEPLGNALPQSTHFNLGFNLRPYNWVDVSMAYERGRKFMFRTALRTNFHSAGIPKIGRKPPPAIRVRKAAAASIPNEPARPQHFERSSAPNMITTRRIPNLVDLAQRSLGTNSGVSVDASHFAGRSAFIQATVENPQELDAVEFELAAAAVATSVTNVALEGVFFDVHVRSTNEVRRNYVDARTIQRVDLVDFLFEEVGRTGVTVEQLEFNDSQITLVTAKETSAALAKEVAATLFLVLPSPAKTAVLHSSEDGSTQVFSRSEVRSAQRAAASAASLNTSSLDQPHRPVGQALTPGRAADVFDDLRREGLVGEEISVERSRAILRASNIRYRQQPIAAGRAARILAIHMPDDVEEFEIVMTAGGLDLFRMIILRAELEKAITEGGSLNEPTAFASIAGPLNSGGRGAAYENPDLYPSFSWSLGPGLRQHIGGGDTFYAYALSVRASARLQLLRGLSLEGSVSHNLTDTFDRLTVVSSASLPHVRSDIKEYLQATDTAITRAKLTYLNSLGPDLYLRLSAGLFEGMYGGYGGEILFRPFGSRFAAGVDVNWVRQRSFRQRFEFLDYSVVTGHLNLHYNLPYQSLLLQANIGQYLAGDRGGTFQVSKLFDSGIRAGVFATLTDIPFDLFGEGSFDKGFFISVPFDLFSIRPSRRGGTFGFRPLTKDGGQKLSNGPGLYDLTAQGNLDEVIRDMPSILD